MEPSKQGEAIEEPSNSAPLETVVSTAFAAKPQKLAKVAILLSIASLLLAGYSVSKNVNS